MAVTLRLTRQGQTKRPFYRIVAAEKAARRDGKFIEIVGTYNPMTNPAQVVLKEEKIRKWVELGAQQSLLVKNLIKKSFPGLIETREESKLKKIQARRKIRKEKLKAKAPKKTADKKEKAPKAKKAKTAKAKKA